MGLPAEVLNLSQLEGVRPLAAIDPFIIAMRQRGGSTGAYAQLVEQYGDLAAEMLGMKESLERIEEAARLEAMFRVGSHINALVTEVERTLDVSCGQGEKRNSNHNDQRATHEFAVSGLRSTHLTDFLSRHFNLDQDYFTAKGNNTLRTAVSRVEYTLGGGVAISYESSPHSYAAQGGVFLALIANGEYGFVNAHGIGVDPPLQGAGDISGVAGVLDALRLDNLALQDAAFNEYA